MPCIQITTNQKISSPKEISIKEGLGRAIGLIPGKSERWLMLSFQDGASMYFAGDASLPAAFVKVGVFGNASPAAYEKLTASISELLKSELGIDPSRIYIQYEESQYWGWNGGNF